MNLLFRIEYSRNRVLFVKVFTKQKAMMAVILAPTVKLLDMVSNFGGILGLFTGISILSVAEIFFWIARSIIKKCSDWKKPPEVLKI